MKGVRLRQAVVAMNDLALGIQQFRDSLGLNEPFEDPGVAAFGLRNAVFAIGDAFLEIVSPVEAETAAGRYMSRRGGDCGYMVMFQVDDLGAARRRAAALGIRTVWEA